MAALLVSVAEATWCRIKELQAASPGAVEIRLTMTLDAAYEAMLPEGGLSGGP
jgi:hypothetical protein